MMDGRPDVKPGDGANRRSDLMPLYHSLGQIIRGRIQSGEWQVGQRIFSERTLMQMFGVSRATVRQGIENLVKEGVLQRVRGKGTFVAPPKVKQGVLRLRDFSKTMLQSGLTPSARLLGQEAILPPLNIQQSLALAACEPVICLQRLLSVNNLPLMIETSYFSAARFPEFLSTYTETEDPEEFLQRCCSIQISQESEVFEPVILESKEAEILGVKSGFPALWVEMIARDLAGSPVLLRTSLLRGDRCRFYIDLTLG